MIQSVLNDLNPMLFSNLFHIFIWFTLRLFDDLHAKKFEI